MHIPKSDTQHTEILTFEEAQKHREESAVYDREKWLYIPDFYSEYRYILGTAWQKAAHYHRHQPLDGGAG